MVIIKSYTDIEQSNKLAEILQRESADMYYCYGMDIHTKKWEYDTVPTIIDADNQIDIGDIPCWSLATLLGVLPNDTSLLYFDDAYQMVYDKKPYVISDKFDNPIDACYEMIVKLHELKML